MLDHLEYIVLGAMLADKERRASVNAHWFKTKEVAAIVQELQLIDTETAAGRAAPEPRHLDEMLERHGVVTKGNRLDGAFRALERYTEERLRKRALAAMAIIESPGGEKKLREIWKEINAYFGGNQ